MAARQDQTQTIISITFGILFFVMSILAYLGYSSAKSEFARAEELASQKETSDGATRGATAQRERRSPAVLIGLDPAMAFADVQSAVRRRQAARTWPTSILPAISRTASVLDLGVR